MIISIVLPAYNEASRLKKAVETVKKYLDRNGYDYEIIIAEDGSTDGTDKIAAELASNDEKVVHLHSDERLGKGGAITRAFKEAKGDILISMDVDLSTDMKHLKQLIDAIVVEGYDIAIGSRLLKDSKTERPFKRSLASKAYNFLVRLLLGSKLHDHQCGFKAFKREVILEIVDQVKDKHWFWDTEVLVLAQRKGYRIKEFPVEWKQGTDTKVKFGRDLVYMLSQILRMWGEARRSSRKFFVFSFILAVSIILTLAFLVGFENILAALSTADPQYIALAAALYTSSFLVRGQRFQYIMSKLGYPASLIFSAESVSISQTMNVITPIRIGDVARAYVFKLKNIPVSSTFSGLAVERIFDLISVIILAFLAIIALSDTRFVSAPLYATAFLTLTVSAVFAVSRMENVVGKIFRGAKDLIKTKSSFVILLSSAAVWLIDIAVCHLILLSFGVNIFPLVALAVSIANITKVLPLTPGGIGTYEAAMTGILASSIDPSLAFTAAIIDHALKNLITLVLGLIALTSLNIRIKDITKQ